MKTSFFIKRSVLLAAALLLCAVPLAFAHEGHDKAPGEEGDAATSGPIAITAEAKTNLALKVEEAKLRTLEKTFMAIGQIEAIPSRVAAVSSRISGRVVDIKATEGQSVKKGDALVEVESRQVGNPPPRVQYAAPIDGVVTRRDVVLNGPVEPDKNLLEIVDLSEVYAEGQVFEGQVALVRAGQKTRLSVESFPGVTFEGTVDLLSGVLEPQTRTLRIWVRVANSEGKLRPNMRATLHIVTESADEVVAIPHSAVLGEAGNLFAFVQTDKEGLVYERRPVVTGIKDDQYVEITEGIFDGDKVVTLGNYQLQYVTSKPKSAEAAHEDAPGTAPHSHGEEAAAKGVSRFALPSLVGGGIVALLVIIAAVARFRRRRAHRDEYVLSPTPAAQPHVPHEKARSN